MSSGKEFDESRLERVGLTAHQTQQMYRLLAIAKYEDRLSFQHLIERDIWTLTRAQGSMGYDMGCDGCGPASPNPTPTKTGKEIYEENFYGGIWRDMI